MPKAYQISLNGTQVDQDFYGDIVSLVVEENTATPGIFRVQLIARLQQDGTWKYVDDNRLAPLNKVSIQIGFTSGGGLAAALGSLLGGSSGGGGLSSIFDGFITNVHLDVSAEPGKTFVEVSGMDTSFLMSLEEKIVAWPDMADSDIVQQIVSAYGAQVKADTTTPVHQENDTTTMQRGSICILSGGWRNATGWSFTSLPMTRAAPFQGAFKRRNSAGHRSRISPFTPGTKAISNRSRHT